MGYYLDPPTNDFVDLVPTKSFVDHTEMLEVIAEKINSPTKKYMAVSRPRRFGKTVDANMIGAFFGVGSDVETFKGLKITRHVETCAKHQGEMPCD